MLIDLYARRASSLCTYDIHSFSVLSNNVKIYTVFKKNTLLSLGKKENVKKSFKLQTLTTKSTLEYSLLSKFEDKKN